MISARRLTSIAQQFRQCRPAACFSTNFATSVSSSITPRERVVPGIVSPRNPVPASILRPHYAETGEVPIQMTESIPIMTHGSEELRKMKVACKTAAKVLNYAGSLVSPGITTDEIDRAVHDYVVNTLKVYPSPLNYGGFPKSLCSSVNDVVVHGIPDDRVLQDGDIVNLDVSVFVSGYHGDTSRTFAVGNSVDDAAKSLIRINEEALAAAIKICKPCVQLREIGALIHDIADANDVRTVKNFTGHGIGAEFHLKPFILHYRNAEPGVMRSGMIFTIEPMFNEKSAESVTYEDGWTVATIDGGRSAQCEHTILITDDGHEILTLE